MAKVRFSASGFATTTYRFGTVDEARAFIKSDAASTAGDLGGTVSFYGDDEAVAEGRDGEELARWELLA